MLKARSSAGISARHPDGYLVPVSGLVQEPVASTVKSSPSSTVNAPSAATTEPSTMAGAPAGSRIT
jgi:hypothetical protein